MKIRIIVILSLILLLSCENEKKKESIEIPTEKSVIDDLPTNTAIDTITNISQVNQKQETVSSDGMSMMTVEFFDYFKSFTETTFLNETPTSTLLNYGYQLDDIEEDNEDFLGFYFMKVFDRTPEHIENFFGDTEIQLLAQIINKNNTFISSNSGLWLDGLLKSYEELKNNPEHLEQLSQEEDTDIYHDLIASTFSAEVTEIMDFESDYYIDYKLFKIYTFWVRRHKEGNDEIVFSILKKLRDKLPVKTNASKPVFDRYKLESQILNDELTAFDFNPEIVNFLISELDVKKNYFERFIAENSIFIPRRNTKRIENFSTYTSNLMVKINKIYSDFDRSPENIEQIFDESLINHIASLFNDGYLSKDHRLYDVLKGLLMTYDEMSDQECWRLNTVIEEYQYHDMRDEFDENCSDKVRNFVMEGGNFAYSTQYDSDRDFGASKRIFYLYSFWVRRYNEGNKETVYKVLKELDRKIKITIDMYNL